MSNPYTTDSLIESMKLDGYLPAGTGLSTPQILRMLTNELGLYMPALLKSIREEFIIAQVDLPVTAATVVVPARACGAALRLVQWVSPDGSSKQLARIEPERFPDYEASTGGEPAGYMFRGSSLILVPAVTSGTLRLAYQQRPGILVMPEDCGEVIVINSGANQVTLSATPSDFTDDDAYDIVSGSPNFDALALDQAVTIAGDVLTFASLPARLAVGDFVCFAGETCIPQMPTELHTVLAQRTAYKIAEATGSKRAGAIAEGLRQAREDVIGLLSPRSDGSARPIIARWGAGRRGWGW